MSGFSIDGSKLTIRDSCINHCTPEEEEEHGPFLHDVGPKTVGQTVFILSRFLPLVKVIAKQINYDKIDKDSVGIQKHCNDEK